MKTSYGLVDYAKAQLGNPYWWGGYGLIANQALLNQMKALYPGVYNTEYYSNAPSQFGKRVFDCVGLIKGYRWSETPTSNPVYVASEDVAVSGLYNQCKNRGSIETMPDVPGTCVFIGGDHVGVYIGDGMVIEARSHKDGVVSSRLDSRPWNKWGQPSWIEYPSVEYYDWFSELSQRDQETVAKWPTLHRGQKSGYAGALQLLLVFYGGFGIEVDGDFGQKTFDALVKWQKGMNLEPDGICGKQTWASFMCADA